MKANIVFPEIDKDTEITDKLAMDYYTALYYAGHKIQLEWNGGGDSGSVYINLDGKLHDINWWDAATLTFADRIHRHVIEKMYDELDYGSWAGEFSATGTADFVVEDDFVGFRGTDYYSEEESRSAEFHLQIIVPAHFIPEEATMFHVDITDGYDGHPPNVYMNFKKKNDYHGLDLTAEAKAWMDTECNRIAELVNTNLTELNASSVYMYDSVEIADRSLPVSLVFDTLNYYVREESDKLVEFNLLP